MKVARLFRSNQETYGFVKEDNVVTKEDITYFTGIPIPQNVKDFLFGGWFDEVKKKITEIEYKEKISSFKILSPIPNPSKIICLAYNYKDHAIEQNLIPPDEPVILIKPNTTLTGTNSDILCPSFVSKLDYEIELALVIGKQCKNIDELEAKEAIFGYMILNDVTARDIQARDKQFTRAKGFDTFAPSGPWITTSDEIPNPQNLRMITKVNDQVKQDSFTSNMFLKIPIIVSMLSKVMTLEKGDIISTGTPAGVMSSKPNAIFLQDGDKIKMEIENLGRIENTVRFFDI
ncbi:MAG: fumarylacetoacetate hydrolase family protein [Thaumarchaeota archaeon]|nr:fumarylacetoacetate hydrolase family protein [Nitrososphaerota archaeon]